jgi:hypothetical protein
MDLDDELSTAGAACMLLVFVTPTDRALTGWAPLAGHQTSAHDLQLFIRWLDGHLAVGSDERTSRHRAARHPNDVSYGF